MTAGEVAVVTLASVAPGPIEAGDGFATAGRKAMWGQVARMLELEPELRDPEALDSIRRYRVATRRLRAAIRVFEDAFPARRLKSVQTRLGDFARTLGTVRDLDVRIANLTDWAAARAGGTLEAVEPLLGEWRRARGKAAGRLGRELDSARHRRLLAGLVAFVEPDDPAPPPPTEAERLVRDRAASTIWAAYERVRAYARVVPAADIATLHRLRVDAKRLRYVVEFLEDVLGADTATIIERLVALQDVLGAMSDTEVALAATTAFLDEHSDGLSPAELEAIQAYRDARAADLAKVHETIRAPWRAITSTGFANRLGSAVVVKPA